MNHRDGAFHLGKKTGMKTFGLIILAILCGTSLTVLGQDAAPPSVDLYEEQNQLEPTPSPELPNGPELPEISQLTRIFQSRDRSARKRMNCACIRSGDN